jgi:hypothetical protein
MKKKCKRYLFIYCKLQPSFSNTTYKFSFFSLILQRPPDVENLVRTYLMFRDTCKFIETIHEGIPIICSLLGSKNSSDVLEAIKFLETALEFKISKAKV